MWTELKNKIQDGMEKSISHLKSEFAKIRGNRASSGMVDSIKFKDAYGSESLIKFASNVTASDDSIIISVWDAKNVHGIERAIMEANIGLNPSINGANIILKVPKLTVERINDIVKIVMQHSEEAKISIRNVRRVINDDIKKMKKDSDISEDDEKRFLNELQKMTDQYVKQIDEMSKQKEEEVRKI